MGCGERENEKGNRECGEKVRRGGEGGFSTKSEQCEAREQGRVRKRVLLVVRLWEGHAGGCLGDCVP